MAPASPKPVEEHPESTPATREELLARRSRAAAASLDRAFELAGSSPSADGAEAGDWAQIAAAIPLMPPSAFEVPPVVAEEGPPVWFYLGPTYLSLADLDFLLRTRYGLTVPEIDQIIRDARAACGR
ncbi:hypothetical protein HNR12_002190 [Streptomonospora nanhaiensis]|uniref:Uncharacterized protein n=1 Tax=Streptomonospora nanhaiensis TaxID=1323731 RepID=A0A853BL06_9ACTN|nr:hypothetical protein [Streptomonospora nanhaiensis]NYI95913.1 hypothetical protein [Streptomonospora nanhaiensis]